MKLLEKFQNAWNAFKDADEKVVETSYSYGQSVKPDRVHLKYTNEKSIIASVYNRIALDVAATKIAHVKVDPNGRYKEDIKSSINDCLQLYANKDQSGRSFIQDVAMSLFDEGCVGIVAVDKEFNLLKPSDITIHSFRVGKIVHWYPDSIIIELYNDRTGLKEQITLPKNEVAIIENPFYAVMNETNSTLRRLGHKLALIDSVDEQTSAGKLDMIIQLPYVIKSEAKRQQAEQRRKDIEMQLTGSRYGIAYIDGTEHVTQLNRSLENNLLDQIEMLTSQLYNQLGIPLSIFNGTASPQEELHYFNGTIEPVVSAITTAMTKTFISKSEYDNGERIIGFRDLFRFMSLESIASAASTLISSTVMAPNEFRPVLGLKPSNDSEANALRNRNINESEYDSKAPLISVENESSEIKGSETNSSMPTTENSVETYSPENSVRSILKSMNTL